uniref:Transmembrane protein n=1 Tax=Syphacia muris TaxID=451379 RepID=A0A0N5APB1_9BILA
MYVERRFLEDSARSDSRRKGVVVVIGKEWEGIEKEWARRREEFSVLACPDICSPLAIVYRETVHYNLAPALLRLIIAHYFTYIIIVLESVLNYGTIEASNNKFAYEFNAAVVVVLD